MERYETASDFIPEDDSNSAIGPLDSVRVSAEVHGKPPKLGYGGVGKVPPAVRQILEQRRLSENDVLLKERVNNGQLPSAAWTNRFRDFCERSREVAGRTRDPQSRAGCSPGQPGLSARTFLDLQAYNLDSVCEKRKQQPGPVQLMFMFYSRIYDKLVGKQRGVDVPLFTKIDNHEERLLSFCAILDWAQDFKLCPAKVGRRELERIFVEVHQGAPDSPRRKFESKITYTEFVDLVALCADAGEPMDRSKLDGSRVRTDEPRIERIKRLASFLNLSNVKKVKLALHNNYRDVHFWKLSDGADFEKEARAAEQRSRPQHRVDPVSAARRLDPVRDVAAKRYMHQFTWVPTDHIWEEFEAPYLDMGTFVMNGKRKGFKLTLQNCKLSLAKLRLEAEDCGPIRLPWRDTTLGPGQSIEVVVNLDPVECGEWQGRILVFAEWTGHSGCEETVVPTYSRVVQGQSSCADLDKHLPHHAPRPFRPGSACRLALDPASITCHQMRAPAPGSRPSSAASTAYTGRFPSGAEQSRPTSASRPGSANSFGVQRSASVGRPGSRGRYDSPCRQASPNSGTVLRTGSAPLHIGSQLPPPLPLGASATPAGRSAVALSPAVAVGAASMRPMKDAGRLRPKGAVPGGGASRRQQSSPPRKLRPHSAPSPSPPRTQRAGGEDDDDDIGAMVFRDVAAGGGAAAVHAARMKRPQSAGIRRHSKF